MVREATEAPRSALDTARTLWERKFIILATVLACTGVTLAIERSADKQYTGESKLLFRDPGFARTLFGSDLFERGSDPDRDASTNIEVLDSPEITKRVERRLALRPAVDIDEAVEIEAGENADVASVVATTGSPVLSARIANAYADEYVIYQRELDRQKVRDAQRVVRRSLSGATLSERGGLRESLRNLTVLESLQTGNADVIARAEPDPTPTSPQPLRSTILAAFVGLILGGALALLAGVLDRRLKTTEDFERAFGLSVIVTIPRGALAHRRTGELKGMHAEPYRMLRQALHFLGVSGEQRCILVTSPDAGEGKSTLAVNLARTTAAAGERVILIEADLRRPTAAAQLLFTKEGGERGMGLSGGIVAGAPLEELLIESDREPGVQVLPSGPLPPNPAELLRAPHMSTLLREARELADLVLVDAPPLLPVADTQVMLDVDGIDGTLLVGRAYATRRDRARQTERVLKRSGQRVLGVVVTAVRAELLSYYYHYAGSGDENGAAPAVERQSEDAGTRERATGPPPLG